MKSAHSAEFYRGIKDEMLKWVPGEDYINLEGQLERRMQAYKAANLPEHVLAGIRKVEAERLADKAHMVVLKEMATVKKIRAGKASFGYITEQQEIRARFEFERRFEFNCWQLAEFRKAYDV